MNWHNKKSFWKEKIIKFYIVCLVFISHFYLTQNRIFQTSLKFSLFGKTDGWIFLDKMTFAPGQVQYFIRTTYTGIPYSSGGHVTIQAIPQQLWQFQLQRKCLDISKQPFTKHKLSVTQSSVDYTRKQFNIQETTLFYFVMKDCKKQLKADYDNQNLNLKIKLHLKNNGKQLGQEEDHWYILIIVVGAGAWLIYFYVKKMKGTNSKQNWHKMAMFGGIACQISSLTWKSFGFLIYNYTGADYLFFHLIYLFMHSISQSLVIGLIILIGFGWTINYQNLGDMQIYLPLLGCMAFINCLLTLLTRMSTSQHDMHHVFDNVSGSIMIGYRILLAIIFVIGIINIYNKSRSKVKTFIIYFAIIGGLYIISLPFIIFIGNNFVQAKDRHQFVFVAIQGLKCVTNIGLSLMLNLEKSYYNQISYQKRSFLPEQSKYF